MKRNIVYLLLIALLGLTVSASIAQQIQNAPKTDTEVEKLKIQLQTLENEKIGLETKLAEANARLINTDIDKLKGELRESNNDWLRAWNNWFVGIVSIVAIIISAALWLVLKTLIGKGIEKRLDGFKESVNKVNILEGQLNILKKEHAVSVLENYNTVSLTELEWHTDQIKGLPEEILLDVFDDITRDINIRLTAIEVLAARKSPRLVSAVLNYLNLVVDSDIDWGVSRETNRYPYLFLSRLSKVPNLETYQGLKLFLNRLIAENPKNKDLFLTWTVYSLAEVSIKLDIRDSKDMLRKVVPDLKDSEHKGVVLDVLLEYFEKFNEYEGIKDILTNDLTDNLTDVEEKCLELLEKNDPNFVNQWKKKKEDANTKAENTDEPKPTE